MNNFYDIEYVYIMTSSIKSGNAEKILKSTLKGVVSFLIK